MIRTALLAAALLMTASVAAAEELPIKRVFAAPALNGPAPRGVQISPDGALVTYLKPEPGDQTTFDLWARPIKGGAERRLIEGAAVEPKTAVLTEAEKGRRERQRIAGDHGVLGYKWDEAGAEILVPAAGKLYLADARTGAVKPLAGVADATDAKISPKGGYVAYVRDQNLHALDLKTGRDVALTTEGGGTLSFGEAEFVAQEEMHRFTGHWTSPDDRLIAFTRVDESPVDVVPRFEIGAEGATVVNQRYPKAGRPNAIVELYVAPITGGARVKVDLGPNADIYLARVDWSKDGRTLYVQRQSRDQTALDLLAVDPATGAAKALIAERQTPWLTLNDDFTPLKTGEFIWGSERTGFHHLYLYKADGTLIRPITAGAWPVTQGDGGASAVAGVDEATGVVYFAASKDGPLTRNLYAVSYKSPGEPKRITGGDGWWTVDLAKDHKSFVGTYTDPKTPPQTALYAIAGQRLGWIEENALKPGHPYYPYLDHKTYPEFGTLTAEDGQTLHYEIIKPYGFDPAKRYPAIVNVYGGPGASLVQKRWAGGTDQLLTQAGFVLFRLDNRGAGNRGLKFEAPIHKAMGTPEVKDQLVGARYLASLSYVDPKRIGVMGWSYGGFMTLRLLTEPGQPFVAGAAGGPPSDWHFYDTHYTERYMGDPRTDAAAYAAAAVLPRLPALTKPGAPRLLLLHGMADDNVVFENSTRIMAALQAQGTPFDLMLYPGERHGVRAPGKQAQLWETYLAFFKRMLGGPQ
jgi:dipeptidyl-peptidase-4